MGQIFFICYGNRPFVHVTVLYGPCGPPRVFLEQGNKVIYFKGKKSKHEGNRGKRQFLGTGNIENHLFYFEEQVKCLIISGQQGNRYPQGGPRQCVHLKKKKVVIKQTLPMCN